MQSSNSMNGDHEIRKKKQEKHSTTERNLAPVYTLHQSFTVECCSCPPLEPAATMKLRRQQILVESVFPLGFENSG